MVVPVDYGDILKVIIDYYRPNECTIDNISIIENIQTWKPTGSSVSILQGPLYPSDVSLEKWNFRVPVNILCHAKNREDVFAVANEITRAFDQYTYNKYKTITVTEDTTYVDGIVRYTTASGELPAPNPTTYDPDYSWLNNPYTGSDALLGVLFYNSKFNRLDGFIRFLCTGLSYYRPYFSIYSGVLKIYNNGKLGDPITRVHCIPNCNNPFTTLENCQQSRTTSYVTMSSWESDPYTSFFITSPLQEAFQSIQTDSAYIGIAFMDNSTSDCCIAIYRRGNTYDTSKLPQLTITFQPDATQYPFPSKIYTRRVGQPMQVENAGWEILVNIEMIYYGIEKGIT